jgi:hypothetical protein
MGVAGCGVMYPFENAGVRCCSIENKVVTTGDEERAAKNAKGKFDFQRTKGALDERPCYSRIAKWRGWMSVSGKSR